MGKGRYKILIVLMSISLLGLIGIQFFWLRTTLKSSVEDFNGRVYQAMNSASEKINKLELASYYKQFEQVQKDFKDAENKPEVFSSYVLKDSLGVTYVYFTRYVLERSMIPVSDKYTDTLTQANVYAEESVIKLPKDSSVNFVQKMSLNFEDSFKNSTYSIERLARLDAGNKPLNKRVDFKTLDSIFRKELQIRGVRGHPQLAVLNKDSVATLEKSRRYDFAKSEFVVPLFYDKDDRPTYIFSTYFPDKKAAILAPIVPIVSLTVVFTLIIITVFSLAIYYMQKQRKISDIKTDFINNMTHEFKTPIATINIASDALKNEKVYTDQDKIKYYADLIKQENNRMNDKVETVLRMSQLEYTQDNSDYERIDIHEITKKSLKPIRFIVEEGNGTIFENYQASDFVVDGDAFHLENVIINILENARKYSGEKPEIYVKTYNDENNIIIEIKDKGIGMSKAVLKKIFDQFYREETGNIHNVKGHGLGLSYVRKIIDLHKGEVWAESEKGKGSTFYIKLPLNKN